LGVLRKRERGSGIGCSIITTSDLTRGIGGLCPADRYFEIQAELRKTMEQGIVENVLEMALRGKPREPFYMVGRMEGQSVVLRAEKGKLRLMVDDEEGGGKQEMVYEVGAKREEKDRSIGRSLRRVRLTAETMSLRMRRLQSTT
jgi:hypothetical protein